MIEYPVEYKAEEFIPQDQDSPEQKTLPEDNITPQIEPLLWQVCGIPDLRSPGCLSISEYFKDGSSRSPNTLIIASLFVASVLEWYFQTSFQTDAWSLKN